MLRQPLSNFHKGLLCMALGVFLLLESWGFFREFFIFVFRAIGFAVLVYGFLLGDMWTKLYRLLEKQQNRPPQGPTA